MLECRETAVLECLDEGRCAARDRLVLACAESLREIRELVEERGARGPALDGGGRAHVALVGVPAAQRRASRERDLADARALAERDAAAAHLRIEVDEDTEAALGELARVRALFAQHRQAVTWIEAREFRDAREVRSTMRIGDEQVDRLATPLGKLEQHACLARRRALEAPQAAREHQLEHFRHLGRLHVRSPAREPAVRGEQLVHAREVRSHAVEPHEQHRRRQVLEGRRVHRSGTLRPRRRGRPLLEGAAVRAARESDLDRRQARGEDAVNAAAVRRGGLVRHPVVATASASGGGARFHGAG